METDKNYAVYIGDVALDEYYRAQRWPGKADKENVEFLKAVPGGMIANAACVRASLDQKTLFWTCMNDGAVSKFLLEDLRSRGIDTSLSVTDNSLPDSKALIFLVGDEHTVLIPILDIREIIITDEMYETMKNASYVYATIGTLKTLKYKGRDWDDFSRDLRKQGARIIVDFDVDYERNGDDSRFSSVDIGFFNETGYDSVREDRSYEQQAEKLHSLGMKLVVVTLAEKGCVIYEEGKKEIRVPARKVDVVDVTGAGDTFCSSFCSVMDEMGIEKAAEFASAAASLCIQSLGARCDLSKEKVLDIMNS